MSWVQLRRAYFYFFFSLFFFLLDLESTNAHFTQSGLSFFFYYICCSSRIYAIHNASLSLSHKYFIFFHCIRTSIRTFTDTHTNTTHHYTLAFLHKCYHIHFATYSRKEYPLLTSNAIQLYNNLKKCIVYIYV